MLFPKAEPGRALVFAPHPDDEVLGAGGVMARLADAGCEVHVCVVTRAGAPDFDEQETERTRAEARKAHALLGVAETHWLDFPAAKLFETPHRDLNAGLGALVRKLAPDTIFTPHLGDIHMDHQLVFLSSLVASRPHQHDYPATILAYETVSETNWNAPYLTPAFTPNVHIDITGTIERKLEAFALFESQTRSAPHERSVATLRALATMRGATIHRAAAEAFVLIRHAV